MAKQKATKVTTPPFIVSYPAVFEPKENLNGKMKYSVSMVFPDGTDLSHMKKACKAAIVAKFGPDKSDWPKKLKLPFRDGNEDKDGEGVYKDATFVSANSNNRPGIVDKNMNEIIDEDDFYAGCTARATVNFYFFDKSGTKGIACGLNNLQFLKDGERLDGRTSAQDDFDSVDNDVDEDDDDDILG